MNAEMMFPSMVNSKMGFLPYLSDTAVGPGRGRYHAERCRGVGGGDEISLKSKSTSKLKLKLNPDPTLHPTHVHRGKD